MLGLVKLIVGLLILSALWVLLYRFVNPPITATMMADVMAGRGAEREWMGLDEIDRDMVRAAVGGEDSKYCAHSGFDWDAITDAARRNASGGRIRGGSTISQQTAKNVFLWQGGGYVRKGMEAWFTFLIEQLWGKRRIMEVYLNVAETGIGTYGVNAGSHRYFGHDASAMTRTEAARMAAVLPLPKGRDAIAPRGFTRRYGNSIAGRIGTVARDGLDNCVYAGTAAPRDRTPPPSKGPVTLPGSDVETSTPPPPPPREVIDQLPAASETLPEAPPEEPVGDELAPAEQPSQAEPAAEPEQPDNGL
ncbi:monofunctional biosynthetic peptidoglycan transglycosylase [Sphingomonas kaistensis]|uniref:Biosynthetic peptidoglycan transglycosylase n=1 Tax=Sphingomonas kaistensis TaxID=298708 RepID=A0A7X5Y943_9SPHN|nr:monofunctional biosynthetic peptidoglycan transglycosylase [Sphingomonas kaistensis]